LIELASGAAEGMGSEEVTYDIREELKKRESTERRKRILKVAPVAVAGFAVVGLIAAVMWLFNELSLTQTVSQRTATAIMRTYQFATEIASRPTETLAPTSTIDIVAAATLQREATQTFAPFATQTQAQVNTQNTATQSALQTVIALTPSNTPTLTRTFTPTLIPTQTNTLFPTSIPKQIFISSTVEGTRFVVEANGTHHFIIASGSIQNCPPGADSTNPNCGTWATRLLVYKNKSIVWNPNPASADYTLGIGRSSTTPGEAEKNGVGSYIDIQLNKGDYVIIVADDSRGDFGDNGGSINVSVSIIAP
jgi:flagellar basal body-associated protein FliL